MSAFILSASLTVRQKTTDAIEKIESIPGAIRTRLKSLKSEEKTDKAAKPVLKDFVIREVSGSSVQGSSGKSQDVETTLLEMKTRLVSCESLVARGSIDVIKQTELQQQIKDLKAMISSLEELMALQKQEVDSIEDNVRIMF